MPSLKSAIYKEPIQGRVPTLQPTAGMVESHRPEPDLFSMGYYTKAPISNNGPTLQPTAGMLVKGSGTESLIGKGINQALSNLDLTHIDLTQSKEHVTNQVAQIVAKRIGEDLEFSEAKIVELVKNKSAEYVKGQSPNIASTRVSQLYAQDENARSAQVMESLQVQLANSRVKHNDNTRGVFGFLKDLRPFKKTAYEEEHEKILQSEDFASLSPTNKTQTRNRLSDQVNTELQARRGRRQSYAFGASLGLPMVTNLLTSSMNPNSTTSKVANGLGESVASGGAVAAAMGFSAPGLVIGGVITSFSALKVIVDSTHKSLEDYNKELEDTQGKFTEQKNSVASTFGARSQLNEAIDRGESSSTINRLSETLQDSIRGITDPTLRRKAAGASTVEQQSDLIAEISHKAGQETASAGLSALLEKTAVSHRGLGGLDWSSGRAYGMHSMTKDELSGVSSLVTGALPLSSDKGAREKQIAQLKDLQSNGGGLSELQKILGNLSDDIQNKLKYSIDSDTKAIAQNVAARNLAAVAMAEEAEKAKVTAGLLLNLKTTLESLGVAASLSFNVSNIRSKGQRDLALQSGSQSLSILDQFMTPESKNRYETQQKLAESKSETVSQIEKVSTAFLESVSNIDKYIKNAGGGTYQSDSTPGENGIGFKNDEFRNQITELRVKAVTGSSNPVEAANKFETSINELITKLSPNADGSKNENSNKQAVTILQSFLQENKNYRKNL